jgi:hypothetical protein
MPENFPPNHYRYFVAYSYVYFAALLFHFSFIFIFSLISAEALAFLNVSSTATWILIRVNPDFSKGIGFEIDTDLSLRPCEQGQ